MSVIVNIAEGSVPEEKFSFGRVCSIPQIKEWYFSFALFGRRYFIASGLYDLRCRTVRYWVHSS